MTFSIVGYPIRENGEITSILEVCRDITQDLAIQKMLMRQDKLSSVGRLAAGVAHEINNPLTSVLTSAMLMLEDMEQDDANYEDMKIIADETMRCRKIVTNLLNFARQHEPEKKSQDLNHVLEECLEMVKNQASFKSIKIHTKLEQDLPHLNIDRDQMRQVIINLLINAMEAMDQKGEIILLTRYLQAKTSVELSVKDNGPGVSEDMKYKVFDPFFTTKANGTGLGLSICLGIIEQHGGTMEVESSGTGTTFIITLPLKE
jgi:signal transduction histidine kinase